MVICDIDTGNPCFSSLPICINTLSGKPRYEPHDEAIRNGRGNKLVVYKLKLSTDLWITIWTDKNTK